MKLTHDGGIGLLSSVQTMISSRPLLFSPDGPDTVIRELPAQKNIALVAHDHCKEALVEWVKNHRSKLSRHHLVATGTTGRLLAHATGLPVATLQSGPLGGDQQIGAAITEERVHALIFFWDPLAAQPHDPDVKALLRLAVVYNIPVASNRASADCLVTSPLFGQASREELPNYARTRRALLGHNELPATSTEPSAPSVHHDGLVRSTPVA